MGLKIDSVQTLSEHEAGDVIRVKKKIKEVKMILSAIAEAQQGGKAVVKSWLESE